MNTAAVILAAGQGTRMKSKLPKVLHRLAGKPMVHYVLDAVCALGCDRTILVVGYGADQVRAEVGARAIFVEQREQLGTGHAVLQAREILRRKARDISSRGEPSARADSTASRDDTSAVFVTYADMPLLQTATLKRLLDLHASSHATITMLTVCSDDSMAFGRVLRDVNQYVVGIIEESEATPEQLAIRELNVGVYCFDAEWLWEHLTQLKPSRKKQEYYLTDLIAMAVMERRRIEAIVMDDVNEALGINTRVHLAQAERIMRERINTGLMLAGVTLIDPAVTYVEADVEIGADTIIEPNTHLKGKTHIGADCRIGPNTTIHDSHIGDGCQILSSDLTGAVVEEQVHIGPFARLRPGAHIARSVYIGNFGEVKNSYIGEGSHIGHFSYIGDAQLGVHVNIGAGTITCNYDGKKKHRTVIGDHAFIGSDTMLRAPVTIGARAVIGAGSVVTKDVPPDTLVMGVPARVIRKLNN